MAKVNFFPPALLTFAIPFVPFILLIFTALVGVWVVDKVIAFKIKLLPDDQNAQLFDLIKTLVLMIFSYYFGTKTAENKKE